MSYTIVGVIGHIDHGKTSLVAALTGIDTDTNPEEKRRGITIDLGFASFSQGDHTFALVDAPGHQKYIGNLLAGVSAVDLGLLVVACDQGIQAQTLEHAAILQALGVKQLIAVISRIDLADDATRIELGEELDLFLADFGFNAVPKVAVSTLQGTGIEELKRLLIANARTDSRVASSDFRMPIDRNFSIPGRGTVIAGTPWSGTAAVGAHLQLARTGESFRVREIEVHGKAVSQSELGMRTAMNIVGGSGQIERGDELVSPGTHPTTTRLIVQLNMFRDTAELRCPATVQLHSATTACGARISGVRRIGGGQSAIVMVDTELPNVYVFGQPCLFRRPYPIGSFAAGTVLCALSSTERQRPKPIEFGRQLVDASSSQRLVAWVKFLGELALDRQHLELQVGISPSDQSATIAAAIDDGQIQMPLDGRLVSNQRIERIGRYLQQVMLRQAKLTERAWLDEAALAERAATTGSPAVIHWVIDRLVADGRLVRVNKMVAIASEETVLSKKQLARMDQILAIYQGSRTPPTVKELASVLQTTMEAVASLLRFATQQRVLIDLGKGFLLDRIAFGDICQDLRSLFAEQPEPTVAEIRDHLGITRKYAIPLLEYCDRIGVTRREGDKRLMADGMDRILEERTLEHG